MTTPPSVSPTCRRTRERLTCRSSSVPSAPSPASTWPRTRPPASPRWAGGPGGRGVGCGGAVALTRLCLQGFAFISFHRREDAARAIAGVSGFGYDHLILNVEWAKYVAPCPAPSPSSPALCPAPRPLPGTHSGNQLFIGQFAHLWGRHVRIQRPTTSCHPSSPQAIHQLSCLLPRLCWDAVRHAAVGRGL